MSRSACCGTTAIFEWRQSGRHSNRSSKSSRMVAQKARRTLKRLTAPNVWGTHKEYGVIEVDARRSRSSKRSAQNHPQLRTIFRGSTHKSPHNWLFLKVVGELLRRVSLRF